MAVMSGQRLPARLLQPPPEVNPGLQLYMNAFWALMSCRNEHLIPWTAVQAYADHLGMSFVEAQDMHFLITRMDIAYMEWRGSKKKKGAGHGEPERPGQQDGKAIQANPRKRG